MARTVRSPDGRTWTIDRTSPNSMMDQTRKEPFFWASLALTILLVAFIVWVIVRGHTAIAIVTGILLAIWVIERGLNVIRPNIQAHTDGPPPETLTWRTTHRYGLGKMEERIADQIEQGRTEGEPPGTVLIGI
jgi:dolichol kinase